MCTTAFEGLAREEAKNLGMPDLHLAIIDHPIGGESPAVMRRRAEDGLAPVIAGLPGAPAPRGARSATTPTPERLTFVDDDELMAAYHARRWTDGLPFVLPTPERVHAMVAGS